MASTGKYKITEQVQNNMSKQIEVLKRIGESNLLEMIDPDLLKLMDLLDLASFNTGSLAKLLIDLEGQSCVADKRNIRENVFKGLSGAEAVELCELLTEALIHHSEGYTQGDVTVRVCWDADRLDLGRVGIDPRPERLCTETARNDDVLFWAKARSKHKVL